MISPEPADSVGLQVRPTGHGEPTAASIPELLVWGYEGPNGVDTEDRGNERLRTYVVHGGDGSVLGRTDGLLIVREGALWRMRVESVNVREQRGCPPNTLARITLDRRDATAPPTRVVEPAADRLVVEQLGDGPPNEDCTNSSESARVVWSAGPFVAVGVRTRSEGGAHGSDEDREMVASIDAAGPATPLTDDDRRTVLASAATRAAEQLVAQAQPECRTAFDHARLRAQDMAVSGWRTRVADSRVQFDVRATTGTDRACSDNETDGYSRSTWVLDVVSPPAIAAYFSGTLPACVATFLRAHPQFHARGLSTSAVMPTATIRREAPAP